MPPSTSESLRNCEHVLRVLAGEAGPVDVHASHDDWIRDDRTRPLERVDLGHQRGVDQPGFAEELLVVPVGVLVREQVADRVVLQREQRVEHRQTDPPVVVKPLKFTPVSGSTGSSPVGSIRSLPPILVAHLRRRVGVGAVELRRIPPVAVQIGVGGRAGRPGGRRIRNRARDVDARLTEAVAGRSRDLDKVGAPSAHGRTSRGP